MNCYIAQTLKLCFPFAFKGNREMTNSMEFSEFQLFKYQYMCLVHVNMSRQK